MDPGYRLFFVTQPNNCDLEKRRPRVVDVAVTCEDISAILTPHTCPLPIPHTDSSSEAPELLLRFVPQSPKSPLAVLPIGQRVISHTGNWMWDICLMPSRLQFMPSGAFYKFSGIQGQRTGVSQGRKYQGLCFLITACIFKEVFIVLLRKKWGLYIHSHLVLCLGFFFPPVVSLFSYC